MKADEIKFLLREPTIWSGLLFGISLLMFLGFDRYAVAGSAATFVSIAVQKFASHYAKATQQSPPVVHGVDMILKPIAVFVAVTTFLYMSAYGMLNGKMILVAAAAAALVGLFDAVPFALALYRRKS